MGQVEERERDEDEFERDREGNDEIAHTKKPSRLGFNRIINSEYQNWVIDEMSGTNVIIFVCQVLDQQGTVHDNNPTIKVSEMEND